MNYKRGKSRRKVRCKMCTAFRWLGNSGRWWAGGKGRSAKSTRNRIDSVDLD